MLSELLLLPLLAGVARAEEMLTYEEALAAAEQANPSLVGARHGLAEAEGTLLGARGIYDPTFEVEGLFSRRDDEGFFQGLPFDSRINTWFMESRLQGSAPTGTSLSLAGRLTRNRATYLTDFGPGQKVEGTEDSYRSGTTITLAQELLKGHRLAYNLQNVGRARRSLEQAELGLERTRQETLRQAADAYWSWVYAEALRENADDALAVAEEALRIGRLEVESGGLAPVEETRLEAARVQARTAALEGRNAAREAADALLLLMGRSPGVDVLPATPPGEVPHLDIDPERAVEVALAQNLDLALARAQVEEARADLTVARHATMPSLTASASAGLGVQDVTLGNVITALPTDDALPSTSVGATLSVPLGNRVARGGRDAAIASLHAAEASLAADERRVASEVRSQVRQLQTAREKMELADVNLRLAQETLEAEEALYDAGRVLLKDVLEARNELERARAEAVKARIDHRQAQVALLALQGQLD